MQIYGAGDGTVANLTYISDALPFGRLWYTQVSHAVRYAEFYSRSHHAVIRVYDEAGNVLETYEHAGISESHDGVIYQKYSFSDDKTARCNQIKE